MTYAALSTLVLSWLDDEQQGYFNPTDVNTWLNLAQREVQKRLLQAGNNWYMKPVETYTVIGQTDYIWPVDFLVEHRLEIVTAGSGVNETRKPLGAITTNQSDGFNLANGQPAAYYIKKDRFTILPAPQQAYLMRLYYSPKVVDMVLTTDSPDVPEQYMEFVALLAAYDGFIKDDRAPTNILTKIQWYEELLKQSAVDRTQDAPRQVVQTMDYNNGNLFTY